MRSETMPVSWDQDSEALRRLGATIATCVGASGLEIVSATRLAGGAIQDTWRLDLDISGGPRAGRCAWVLRADAPSETVQVEYWLGNRSVEVRRTKPNAWLYLARLHMAIGTGPSWVLLSDAAAIALGREELISERLGQAFTSQSIGQSGVRRHVGRADGMVDFMCYDDRQTALPRSHVRRATAHVRAEKDTDFARSQRPTRLRLVRRCDQYIKLHL